MLYNFISYIASYEAHVMPCFHAKYLRTNSTLQAELALNTLSNYNNRKSKYEPET